MLLRGNNAHGLSRRFVFVLRPFSVVSIKYTVLDVAAVKGLFIGRCRGGIFGNRDENHMDGFNMPRETT